MSYERLTKYDGFDRKYHVHQISFQDLVDRLAELEDKIKRGELIDTTEPFIQVDNTYSGKTWYCVCTPMISAVIHEQCASLEEAEAKLKELKEKEDVY